MKAYKLVIFDLDGTILDTLHQLTIAFNEALKRSGYKPRAEDYIRSRIGNGSRKLVLSMEDLDGADPDVIGEDYRRYYNEHCTENTTEYDGMTDLFERLKRAEIRTAVVTNKSHDTALKLCDNKFPGLIDIVKGHRDGIAHKPDPFLVNEVLHELDLSPDEAVFVGDSEVDIRTASNSGMDCISVTWGYKSRDFLIDNGASVLADDVDELTDLIIK